MQCFVLYVLRHTQVLIFKDFYISEALKSGQFICWTARDALGRQKLSSDAVAWHKDPNWGCLWKGFLWAKEISSDFSTV